MHPHEFAVALPGITVIMQPLASHCLATPELYSSLIIRYNCWPLTVFSFMPT